MCLINTADLEGTGNPFMTALHGMCIFCIKRASLLVYHNPVILQCIVTVSVKFPGKQSFRRTKRIRGIHDDKIISCFTSSDKSQRIFIMKMNSSVIQSAGISRKIGTTGLNNHRIHFYQINVTHSVISGQFTDNAAISGTDYQNVSCLFMDRHRHMRDHLIINKFVTLCQHYISVQSQHTAKFRCLKNINSLILTLSGIKLAVYTDAVFHIWCMKF